MKRLGIITGTIAAIIVSAASIGCTEEINVQQEPQAGTITREFTASFAELTRTALEEGGKVSWCKGDTIWYYTENSGKLDFHIIEEDCISATINVTMNESSSFIVAYYGDIDPTYNTNSILQTKHLIPAVQSGAHKDAHKCIAQCNISESSELIFHNMTSMVKFTLERDDIHCIAFSSNDGTSIWNENHYISIKNINIRKIDNKDSGTIYLQTNGAGTFYLSLLPTILEKGFHIECYDKDMQHIGSVMTKNNMTLGKSEILNLGTLDDRILKNDFIIYHINGPKDPKPNPTPGNTEIPSIPGTEENPIDEGFHIFKATDGSTATFRPDNENGGYFFTFGGSNSYENGKDHTIIAHTDQFGKIENFMVDEKLYSVEYSGSEASISTLDADGEIHTTSGLSNPYPESQTTVSYTNYSKVYRDQVITGISLFFDYATSQSVFDIASSFVVNGVLDLIPFEEWIGDDYSKVVKNLIGGVIGKLAFDYDEKIVTWWFYKMKLVTPLNLVKSSTVLKSINAYWIIGSAVVTLATTYYDISEKHKEKMRQLIFSNAFVTTLDWKQQKDNSVELNLYLGNKAPTDNFKVGIIIGSTGLLNQRFYDLIQMEPAENDKELYTITFSGLKTNRTYYYRAVMISPEDFEYDGLLSFDYWAYGNTESFELSPDYGDEYITAVDLGLSVKWASCNLGATRPEDAGNYYAWGEVETKEEYNINNYIHIDQNRKYTKYCTDTKYGKYDGRTVLTADDDAAQQHLGGKWQIPSSSDWYELYTQCSWGWTTINGIKGYKICGIKEGYRDNYIFIPAAGIWTNKKPDLSETTDTSWGNYWSNELHHNALTCECGITIEFTKNTIKISDIEGRYKGLPIRAVLRK